MFVFVIFQRVHLGSRYSKCIARRPMHFVVMIACSSHCDSVSGHILRLLSFLFLGSIAVNKKRPVTTDVACSVVCVSVCALVTLMYGAKSEPIEMPFRGGADSRGPKEPYIGFGSRSDESIRSRNE